MSTPPAHFSYQECAHAILSLREVLRLSQKQLADKIGVGLHLVDSWENARFLPMNPNLTKLELLANRNRAMVLAAKFRDLKQQATEQGKAPAYNTQPPHTDNQARTSGREMALIEAIHLIDMRRAHVLSGNSMLEAWMARGMTISQIVAHELESLKESIRNLPPDARHQQRQHVRHHIPKQREQHA